MRGRGFGFSRRRKLFSEIPVAAGASLWEGHMLEKLLNAVFGCWHLRYSFPITLRPGSLRRKATAITGTYVVCLECGKELPYDWNAMKIVSTVEERTTIVTSLATKRAA
jgi:hypothetical protein